MSQDRGQPKGRHTVLSTVVISVLAAVVIGGILYYTFKRQDLAHTQEIERLTVQVSERQAMAASRVFAALGRQVVQIDLANIQEFVNGWSNGDALRDVVVVSRDNVVLAAKVPAQVGQKIQDPTWLSWKAENREVAQRAVDGAGQPVFVVVEPLRERGETQVWAMLTFAVPQTESPLRLPEERLEEVLRLLVPIWLVLLVTIALAMKLTSIAIRKQVQQVMAEALNEPAQQDGGERLRKVH